MRGGKSSQDFLHLQRWRCILFFNFIWNLNFLDFLLIYLCAYQWAIQIRKWCSPRVDGAGKGYTAGLSAETACFVCVQVSPPGLPKNKQITEIASFDDPFVCPRAKIPRQPSGWLPADQHFTQSMKSKVAQFFCLFFCLFLSPLILSYI